jgi:hypothetical protein
MRKIDVTMTMLLKSYADPARDLYTSSVLENESISIKIPWDLLPEEAREGWRRIEREQRERLASR